MAKVDRQKPLIVLRGRVLDESRRAKGLRITDLAKASGVGYGSTCRALASKAIGEDLAARIVAALGLSIADVTAASGERRPADGYSPEALEHFNRLLIPRLKEAVSDCHSATAAEARRRCWFWPTHKHIEAMISLRQRTASGERVLL